MRRFRRRDDLGFVSLPGVGRLRPDQVLEGDSWAKFCPSFLVEILDSSPTGSPMASSQPTAPKLLTEVPPTPVSSPSEEQKQEPELLLEKKPDFKSKTGKPFKR